MKYPDDFINKIIQGDCLEIMKNIPDQSVDLCLTDPPYSKAKMEYEDFDNKGCVNDLILNFLNEAKRISKITIFPSGKYETELMLYKIAPPKVINI